MKRTVPARLLLDGAGKGAWNMGVDEALFERADREGVATLRLYAWDGAWLSLGYGQTLTPARRSDCLDARVGIVRRATGGRAVLHGADLTYALAAPKRLLPPGLEGSYGAVSDALSAALQAVGVQVDVAGPEPSTPTRDEFDCYARSAPRELQLGGRKLAGSAQRRSRTTLLQHGSIRLRRDPERALVAAGLGATHATSLAEEGKEVPEEALRHALVTAFEERLGWSLGESPLLGVELERARVRQLRHEQGLLGPRAGPDDGNQGASQTSPDPQRERSRAALDGR